ncbi:HEL187Wp [Eremothecium sinecaudum]|uniref:HEL187Wp n=1 Tax=Eremothecium sinecaudum TaxID=45286 RepID=A0A0X8HTD3_9SACH|nr:HEL187Wp [Eremothecium sinecaudum]AMD21094.1 HEL187Wp [Eremothecium sinecaudum]
MVGVRLKDAGRVFRRHKEEKGALSREAVVENASDFEDDLIDDDAKANSRRPKETRFTQQRIAAINLVLRPLGVLSFYLLLTVVFIIAGAVMYAVSSNVDEITIYYHDCATRATGEFQSVPEDHYWYSFHVDKDFAEAPQWRYVPGVNADDDGSCQLRFKTPYDIENPIYVSYLIENFYANHRRYVLSFNEDQLKGKRVSVEEVQNSVGINCRPLSTDEQGQLYYPCGLIANSMFNDSFPFSLRGVDNTPDYPLTNKGINWNSDKDRYKMTQYSPQDVVPPPYWRKQYPNGYNETNMPNINEWEEFQNWMRTSTLPKFSKLIRRNDNDTLPSGEYEIEIGLHWPVEDWNGKKAVYITNGSKLGGRNHFFGLSYLVGGSLCFLTSIVFLVTYFFKGRKLGDTSLLSWNRNQE